MKKTLLIASALFALTMQAQDVKFVHGNQTIEQGSTYKCYDWNYDDLNGEYLSDPEISLCSDIDITVNVVAKSESTDHFLQLCCGGLCARGSEVIKENISLTANTPLATQFEAGYYDDMEPQTIISTLSVYENGTNNLINSITVICDANSNSVALFEADNNSVKAADGKLLYTVDSATTLALYGTDGTRVVETAVEGNGEINTTGLEKGVYVYTIGKKCGKIIVK